MILTILGSNSAVPSIKAFQSAHLLELAGENFLIDCGEGTQMRLRQFASKKIRKINHIFITHAHIDHFSGLPGLLNSLVLQYSRTEPIYIYAPNEVFSLLGNIISMIRDYSKFAINTVIINTEQSCVICESQKFTIKTLPLIHVSSVCGFLFEEICSDSKIKRYAYCSDTSYNEKLIPILNNVELLYHESTYSKTELTKALLYGHSTSIQAATLAREVNAGQLLIGHFAGKYANPTLLLEEAQVVFKNTIAVYDGFTINTSK
jgi:ribonuclease Z